MASSPCKLDLPPTLIEHMTNPNRPDEYYYFWGFGAVFVIITCSILIKRIRQFYNHAIHIRDERNDALLPFPYIACLLFVLFPVVSSILKYLIFLSPISAFTIDFIIKSYESVVLFFFTRLLILYLGSYKNTLIALQEAPKTKWMAVPPFGCCFRPCCKPSIVDKKAFRILFSLILQYCLIAPLFTFMLMLRTYQGSKNALLVLKIIKLLSAMICFYGLIALLRASESILKQYKIHGKFWCIKGLIVVMIVPSFIMTLFNNLPGQNEGEYNNETMVEAYGSFISIICFTLLSIIFLKFFKPEDALYALHNNDMKDHLASNSLAKKINKEHIKDYYNRVIVNTRESIDGDDDDESVDNDQMVQSDTHKIEMIETKSA